MNVAELLTKTGPIRLLCGEDRFAIDAQIARYREVFDAAFMPELNIERFYGDDSKPETIADACRSMPAFAEGRLVIWQGNSKAQATKMLGKLASYIAAPNPSTLLVLVLPGDPDGRLKVIKAAKKSKQLMKFDLPDEAAAALWVTRSAQEAKIPLDSSVARHLVSALGCDRLALRQALNKLDLFAEGRPVDRTMVDQVINSVLDEDVWALADLLAAGRLGESLALVHQLLDDQRSGHELVPGLSYRFRSLARILGAQEKRVPTGQVAKLAGVSPWELKRTGSVLKGWTGARMRLALQALGRADDRVKGGWGASERATMEALCLEVCCA